MTNRQVVKRLLIALILCWVGALAASQIYQASPIGQSVQAAAFEQTNNNAAQLWTAVRAGDPEGRIFLHYALTDSDGAGGAVVWVTVTNHWFHLSSGEQQQLREELGLAWGRILGKYKGPIILVDVTGRQL